MIVREVKGIITRLCVQWVEEGERSTRVFFGLKKSNSKKKSTNQQTNQTRHDSPVRPA